MNYGAVDPSVKDASTSPNQKNLWGAHFLYTFLGSLVLIAGAINVVQSGPWPFHDELPKIYEANGEDIELKFTGDYADNYESASVYYGWDVVEPHRTTTLVAFSVRTANSLARWTITNNYTNKTWVFDGDTVEFDFDLPGTFYVAEVEARGLKKSREFVCKYVRREIRRLNEADREAYLHALHEVYFTSEEIGKKKWGESFRNIKTFTKQHSWTTSLNGSCTPYHFSEAFYVAHAAISVEVERVMQLVEPSTAMHYWNFVIDGKQYGYNWTQESSMFQPDWFGSLNPVHDDHLVTEGRWAYTPLPVADAHFKTSEANAYGIVSMRWNNNPSRYLQRAQSICGVKSREHLATCSILSDLVSTSFISVVKTAAGSLHGWCHMNIGGAWDCGHINVVKTIEEHPDWTWIKDCLSSLWQLWQNSMISGVVSCPHSCSLETSFEDCRCYSRDYDLNNLSYSEAKAILTRTKFWDLLENTLDVDDDDGNNWNSSLPTDDDANRLDDDYRRRRLLGKDNSSRVQATIWAAELVASVGQLGAFATPYSSTNDPLFWPLHTFLVKMIDTTRINPVNQPMNYSWSSHYTATWYNQDHCPSSRTHKPPFDRRLGLEHRKPGMDMRARYTNAELLKLLDVKNEELPYVYDHWVSGVCDMDSGALPTLD